MAIIHHERKSKMKRITPLILIMAMVLSLALPVYASADYTGAIGGFKMSPKSTYSQGSFSDINTSGMG